ncbi:HAD family phosphatase [Marivirga sp. S37H4]|uniref:HAD family phosphatase n=1 Tax=Marivirga aurantiaca TaxID=2802615 RepID=A0A934WZR2_9BACT|nr:HAD family phosphatase [Marivirga aurantiaca]MBK6266213.1 HAD family phosphatase [Marivirga aurantiaca]
MDSHKIKMILFDLGGVIINLHTERTIEALAGLSKSSVEEVREAYENAEYFKILEKGLISETDFRNELRKDLKLSATDSQIDKAWSAMLGTIPEERIEQIKELSENFDCVILSNTNAIHERAFHEILSQSTSYTHLNDIFHHVHFSHDLNMRKPDIEIYHKVLDIHQTEPQQVIFLEDTEHNLTMAAQAGIHTLHIPRNEGFYALLSDKLKQIK